MLTIRITGLFLWILFSNIGVTHANNIFKNLTVNEGLAHTDANCVAQDSTGLIWIGTNAGLQKFNGYQLQTIDYYPSNQKIYEAHNRINAMECSKDYLWIGSDSGLTCLDLSTHRYVPYTIIANDSSLLKERIHQLAIDNIHQRLWIRTENRLCIAKIEENNTLRILNWENDNDRNISWSHSKPAIYQGYAWTLTNNYLVQMELNDKIKVKNSYDLSDILQYSGFCALFITNDFLYLRFSQGCCKITLKNGIPDMKYISYINFHEINPAIPKHTNGCFLIDNNETIWCSYFGGILKVDNPFAQGTTIRSYLANNKNINFSQGKITSLLIDTYNNLWIPMASRGVYYRSLQPSPFHSVPDEIQEDFGVSKSEISSIAIENNTAIWIIIEGGRLIRYDIKKKDITPISLNATQGTADQLHTLTLSTDQKKIYIGSWYGLLVYDIQSKKSHWLIGEKKGTFLNAQISISKIAEDQWGRLWICSWGKGIYCIENPHTNPSIKYYFNSRTRQNIISDFITDLLIKDKAALLCTDRGLNKIWMNNEGEIENISAYQSRPNSPHSLSSDYIACIAQQNDSIYWVGTIGGGLNKLTIHSRLNNDYSATPYTQHNGLTSNDCEIVYLDEKQNVWIGGNGISCFNPETVKISVYELTDGLQTNSFKIGVGAQSSDGAIYMGGIGGGNYFLPQNVTSISQPVSLSFSDLYVNNKIITPQTEHEGRITLSTILDKTRKLELAYNQNNFIISFSALGYNLSNRIMYRYKMVGYDKKWQINPYSIDRAHYSNLPHGEYKFLLQVSTDRGYSWATSEKSIEISILPPWWLTGWAKTLYIIVFTLIITTFGYQYHQEQKLKREKHIQEIQRVNEEERHQSKMRFFMNISHELKTPLTLITLAAERMAELNLSKECMAILSNSQRMLSLITELVDIRKTDLGINRLDLSFQNISKLVEQLYMEMIPWAEKKNITISFHPAKEDLKMDIDRDKIGKLVINLISNAIKYTPEKGKIELSLKQGMINDINPMYSVMHKEGEIPEKQPICIFIVRDTGIGISSESIGNIYDRFFQVKDTNLTHLGSGIGLAIAKNMALLHKGCIIVSSERTVGTEFIVALPITNETISQEKTSTGISSFDSKEFIEKQYIEYLPSEKTDNNSISTQSSDTGLPTLLIVEDNRELQKALFEQLSSFYNIQVADNGKIGLEMCETLYPDIIISDVMMPEMDGIEMCKKIRENLSIAYIPIILLTAKGNVDNQIEGYESGADLYIPKPFSAKFLEVNIRRLLQQKERWLKPEQQSFVEKKCILEDHKPFVEQLRQLIEENIGNPDFSIDFLCHKFGMGRTKLYSKMKEISEQPLADYIRNIRLEKAAYLLRDSELNVNEVMLETGFVNNSHFSKIFKLKYGVTPSEYKKNAINN